MKNLDIQMHEDIYETRWQEPSSIAIDWMARNLYYSSDLSIGVIRIDGKENYHRQLLTFNQTPTSLVVHPKIGFVLFVHK